MSEVLIGIVIGALMIVASTQQKMTSRFYGACLISLPIIYAAFGMLSSEIAVVWAELAYGLPFFFIGFFCCLSNFKHAGYIVAVMWFLHGCYDVSHDIFLINAGVPSWYLAICCAVDFVVGSWVLSQEMVRRQSSTT